MKDLLNTFLYFFAVIGVLSTVGIKPSLTVFITVGIGVVLAKVLVRGAQGKGVAK